MTLKSLTLSVVSHLLKDSVHLEMRFLKILIILIVIGLTSCGGEQGQAVATKTKQIEPVFAEISSGKSGIKFSNTMDPDMATLENLFDFDYYYNGAGVGIGDINNDGLQDIFFASNEGKNTLYLNEGDLTFRDITESSGINTKNKWSNGVTFVDINNDELLDIYITQGGPYQENERSNLLLINQGNLTFKEEASTYGLADKGIGTQSAFADFDNDGDLDCIVMNEAELYGYNVEQFLQKAYSNKETLYFNSSHIYENRNGLFVDITESAGLLTPSFGLGLLISDFNNDNLPDIYMANDYYLPDRIFINKGGLTFSEEHKKKSNQMSFFGMGVDAGDINNDNYEDLFVLDMASSDHYRSKTLMASMDTDEFDLLSKQLDFGYQYMFNSLLLNDTKGRFNNIAHMAGVAMTDWSWAGIIQDYNQDGYRDIIVTNGYRKYGTDNDFKNKVKVTKSKYNNQVPLEIKQSLYNEMPEEKMKNILYLNNQDLGFTQASDAAGGFSTKTFSNGAAAGDLDNDGDIDLVINNIDQAATLLENQSSSAGQAWLKFSFSTDIQDLLPLVSVYKDDQKWSQIVRRTRGYMSSCEPIAHFGLGKIESIDSVVITCQGKRQVFRNISLNESIQIDKITDSPGQSLVEQSEAFTKQSISSLKLFVKHKENAYNDFAKEILLPYKQGTRGPLITKLGNLDAATPQLFYGNALGANSAVFTVENGLLSKNSTVTQNLDGEISAIISLDLNKDGILDYVVGTGDNSETDNSDIYQNYLLMSKSGAYTKQILPGLANTGDIVHADFDNDGYEEFIIGNRIIPQKFPLAAETQYFDNREGKISYDKEKSAFLSSLGIVNDMAVSDIDQDGLPDIIIASEWEPIRVLLNRDGGFSETKSSFSKLAGWWYSIEELDINKDGLPDFVLGNLGVNSKYKVSEKKPLKVYADDFDNSGSLDIVLSKKYNDEYVPLRGRECSSEQMPFVAENFKTYDQFAKASLVDVYGSMDNKYQKKSTEFRHVILVNQGNGKFNVEHLPAIAQMTPVLDMVKYDLNNDGSEDIIAAGNIYNTEAETPRLDYNSVVVMISDGKSNFKAIQGSQLGIHLSGAAKSLEIVEKGESSYLIIGINNQIPEVYLMNTISF